VTRTAIESALHAWVVAGSGLGASSVIFAAQPGPRPAAPYCTIRIMGISPLGSPYRVTEPAAVPAPNADVELSAVDSEQVAVQITAFAGPAGAATGATAPDEILAKIRRNAGLPGRIDALHAGGISIASFEPSVVIDGQFGGVLEPRASMLCRGFISSTVSELVAAIETVEITDQVSGDVFTVST